MGRHDDRGTNLGADGADCHPAVDGAPTAAVDRHAVPDALHPDASAVDGGTRATSKEAMMHRRVLLKKAAAFGAALALPVRIAATGAADRFQPIMDRVAQAATPGRAGGIIQNAFDAGLITGPQRAYLIQWVGMREMQGGF